MQQTVNVLSMNEEQFAGSAAAAEWVLTLPKDQWFTEETKMRANDIAGEARKKFREYKRGVRKDPEIPKALDETDEHRQAEQNMLVRYLRAVSRAKTGKVDSPDYGVADYVELLAVLDFEQIPTFEQWLQEINKAISQPKVE